MIEIKKRFFEIGGKPADLQKLPYELYRKRPVQVRAVRMDERFKVETLEGVLWGKAGDWLIIGVKGEAYPCDHEIFKATYTKSVEACMFYVRDDQLNLIRDLNDDLAVHIAKVSGIIAQHTAEINNMLNNIRKQNVQGDNNEKN